MSGETREERRWMASAWKRLARRYVRMYENAVRREQHYRRDARTVLAPFESESICQACGGPNVVWFAPNDVWNRVMPDEGGILCPTCFVGFAERAGLVTSWRLTPEVAHG